MNKKTGLSLWAILCFSMGAFLLWGYGWKLPVGLMFVFWAKDLSEYIKNYLI